MHGRFSMPPSSLAGLILPGIREVIDPFEGLVVMALAFAALVVCWREQGVKLFRHTGSTPATEVDHIIPIEQRPDLRLVMENLQSACHRCHSAKTVRENAFAGGEGGLESLGKSPAGNRLPVTMRPSASFEVKE